MFDVTACPDPGCGAPAEVVDRFHVESTEGLVEHVATMCARRHCRTLPSLWQPPLSHDRPCSACGHPEHHVIPCDRCECDPPPVPGTYV